MSVNEKSEGAFRTIGEVATATGVAPHVLRYWETRFPELRPVTRAGNRRYYRPSDIALIERIQRLLGTEGYTVKGVQKLLAAEARGGKAPPPPPAAPAVPQAEAAETPVAPAGTDNASTETLRAIRDRLQRALDSG
ncbi:MerR family transcriptional regulator [Sphingomonas mucosissima]|uniref:HTH-type transcriptional regulator MlrA n=1 Tax=Sphingomonas mucosissima TaxID=370959 RepID=A0A245ZIX2_9SPHN|nr:MerR family transcriptional regulator [Sphingomonas mucosissima]OWK29685.1 HTH-type transcriptional regulator MlrA [Sphingomonas mucosissima]